MFGPSWAIAKELQESIKSEKNTIVHNCYINENIYAYKIIKN
jgi:predicted RecB family nuclease